MRLAPASTIVSGRFAILSIAAALAAAGSGCSTYRSKPLDQASVDRALVPPAMDSVRVAAAQIKHPLLAPMVIDGRGGYTPDEIAVMVVIVSPGLRVLRDQRGVAQAQVLQAGILPNPQFGYSVDRPHGVYDPAVVSGGSLGLSWEVTSLLTRRDQVGSAKAGAKAVDLTVAWEEWQTAQDARLRAFRILSLERRIPLARSIEEGLADTLALSKKAVALGLRTTADLTAAAESWSQAQNARFDLEQQLTSERAALNVGLGMASAGKVPLKYAAPDPSPGPAPTADELLQGLEERRLDLVALRYGYESQEASLRAAVIAQFPKIGLNVNKANDTTPIYTRGLGVTVDLPFFDRNQGQIGVAQATRQQLFDEYVARVAEARSQVGQALANLAIARTQLATVEASLPDLAKLVSSYETALESRNADELAYRDARAALATRQMEQYLVQQQVLELGVALEIATGRPSIAPNPSPASL
ncbi:MAG TPA: TolC family protein [Opitutaceae bacterium]|nr:TolC family protein [Opitutaceae bacterium]